jgi:hypothetical protein
LIQDYFQEVSKLIAQSRAVASHQLSFDQRAVDAGYVRGDIYFIDGSRLHLREFVSTEFGIERFSYAYHYQRADGTLVFRYDDTAHFPELETFPHHKHEGEESNVISSRPPLLGEVMKEIETLISLE